MYSYISPSIVSIWSSAGSFAARCLMRISSIAAGGGEHDFGEPTNSRDLLDVHAVEIDLHAELLLDGAEELDEAHGIHGAGAHEVEVGPELIEREAEQARRRFELAAQEILEAFCSENHRGLLKSA